MPFTAMDTVPVVLTWSSLPTEVRCLILHTLAKEASGLSRYASVCREWQEIIETINFSRLRVTPSCLSHLNTFGRPRRRIVRCIEFCILLQEYDCSQCNLLPNTDWWNKDECIIEHALRNFMSTLAMWEPCESSLTVDISIHSPSDAKHHFQNFIFDKSDDHNGTQKVVIEDDVHHGWAGNRQVSPPPIESIMRVLSLIELTEGFWLDLPHVQTVTRLQFRRQTRRQWCQRSLQRFIPYFHGLEILYYEPWKNHLMEPVREIAEYNVRLIEFLSRCPLKQLVIFEDFVDYHAEPWPKSYILNDPVAVRRATTTVSHALGPASLELESLSASFIVDARQFFKACQPTWIWNRLTSLALTSRSLKPDGSDDMKTDRMLQIAAPVAVRMPKLDTMALWNYNPDFTCVFLYETSTANRLAKVTWRATWDVNFTPTMVSLWEAVAFSHGMSGLLIMKDILDSKLTCVSHGHAIEHLRLPCRILHPDSILQIQQELASWRLRTDHN